MTVIRVPLYWQHDLDLIALAKNPDFDLPHTMKEAARAYARKQPYVIHTPKPQPYSVKLESCVIHFRLNPVKDADVIECLNGFRSGHRLAAIKNIFRQYMETAYLPPYYNSETYQVNSKNMRRKEGVKRLSPDEMPVLIKGQMAAPEMAEDSPKPDRTTPVEVQGERQESKKPETEREFARDKKKKPDGIAPEGLAHNGPTHNGSAHNEPVHKEKTPKRITEEIDPDGFDLFSKTSSMF